MLKKYVKEKVETLNIIMENYRRIEIIFEDYVEILQSKKQCAITNNLFNRGLKKVE